jgi:hypothetical protein
MWRQLTLKLFVLGVTMVAVCGLVYRPADDPIDLANRIPEAAPYVTAEAQSFSPPFEEYWKGVDNPGQCESCHKQIFQQWNGSMMANAWRDPLWRGAFLLSARSVSTDGGCSTPDPPDGTPKAHPNPFAKDGDCSSSFDIGAVHHTLTRPGSLLDGFCSRCHMPSNYVDNVPLQNVRTNRAGIEDGRLDEDFDPTSDNGTGIAFATLESQMRNTDSGKNGVFCAVCHTMVESRDTPYHNMSRASKPQHPEYVPALGGQARSQAVPKGQQDILAPPQEDQPNLGYAIGAGSFRLSPHAIGLPERFGPLAANAPEAGDGYLSGVFKQPLPYGQVDNSKHHGYYHVMLTRAEMCSACHDVTNPLTIKNPIGHWVGGFPIERTYAEWLTSRYADRPGNRNFDPAHKRDCQTCHMQQDYGQPGTAQTLYDHDAPRPPLVASVADGTPERPLFTHHFVGGNTYIPHMIGANESPSGSIEPYPELSVFSFTSADEKSPYSNAYWTGADRRGAMVQQARLAWDRLRNVLDLELAGPEAAAAGEEAMLRVSVTNSGSGHKFPTGFPEGRIAWLAVRAFDLATGRELQIHDHKWDRVSLGVGYLTDKETIDPNFPKCNWKLPAGSPDPYAYQFKAVASLGDGCPTLELVYASALNMAVNDKGQPIDAQGRVIDRSNPRGLPVFKDLDGDGDLYDDSFLRDTRLEPLPVRGSQLGLDRYGVVIPPGTVGPVAVTAAVYYQSAEAIVAQKFLGNLADTDLDFKIEPCVLGGACDGRIPSTEPAVVEGAPPVPMEVRSVVIRVGDGHPRPEPSATTYPPSGATVARDVVVKAFFSEPMKGVDATSFRLFDSHGSPVPAWVDQIGDGTWGLFPHQVFLNDGETYTARIAPGACGFEGNCIRGTIAWSFTASGRDGVGRGDTRVPLGFPLHLPAPGPPLVTSVRLDEGRRGGVVVTFSEPVMNVTAATLSVGRAAPGGGCDSGTAAAAIPGTLTSSPSGDVWTYTPRRPFEAGMTYCVRVSGGVYDLEGQKLPRPFTGVVSTRQGFTRSVGSD